MRRRAGDFEREGEIAAVYFRADLDPGVVRAAARPAPRGGPDAFELLDLPVAACARRRADGEEVVIGDAARAVRMEIVEGSLLAGPVHLDWRLSGVAGLEPKLAALRRFAAIGRLRRMPASLFPPEPKAARWALALDAHDARRAGASQRDIAMLLFGRDRVEAAWRDGAHMRMRVRRLLRAADDLVGGGFLRLLR